MGEVYRARDTKLGREAAIKVLPDAVSADRDRLTRDSQSICPAVAESETDIVLFDGLI